MLSIVILTKNEENDIGACLDSISWCDDVHLLDSGSSDRTLEVAGFYKITVSHNPFVSFGQQRNHALDQLALKYEWVLFLDADEVCTPAFRGAIIKAIMGAPEQVAGYYCCWKMMLDGTWLKRCDSFPKWQFRMLRKTRARFTDHGHGQKEDLSKTQGELRYITEPYLHYGFSKGWAQWLDRHNKYSTQEALARIQPRPLLGVFTNNGSSRNTALKYWLTKIPGWPLFRFLHAYLLKLGFLEGRAGLIYCLNVAYYEFLIVIKIREAKRRKVAERAHK